MRFQVGFIPRIRVVFWWILLGTISFSCTQIMPVQQVNMAYLYDQNAPVGFASRMLRDGDQLQVFVELKFRKLEGLQNHLAIWDKYLIRYQIRPGYSSRKILFSDTLRPSNRIVPAINPMVLAFRIPQASQERVVALVVRESQSKEEVVFDIPIPPESETASFQSVIFRAGTRVPIFESFITTQDSVEVFSVNPGNEKANFEYFPFSSSVALPPMAAIPASGHDFEKKSVWSVPLQTRLVFDKPGYYFLPANGLSKTGLGVMVAEPFFPRVTLPLELAEPMVYISTREERKNLLASPNPKQLLDDFWLKANSQKDIARKLIRSYFGHIEEANRLFSSHKAGWRTDRGMVMAIYGPPPKVYKNWDLETWQYDKSLGGENTVFYFTRRPAEKNPNIWELKRYNEYDRVWYGVVELWRKGIINR